MLVTHLQSFLNRRFAIVAVCALGACGNSGAPIPDLMCRTSGETVETCTEVPSLTKARIALSGNGTFVLTGHYQACHHSEDVHTEGTFQAFPHDKGVDLELLARRSLGGDPRTQRLERTIGLINLNTETLVGRFTDTTALIRSRGHVKDSVPSLRLLCSKK